MLWTHSRCSILERAPLISPGEKWLITQTRLELYSGSISNAGWLFVFLKWSIWFHRFGKFYRQHMLRYCSPNSLLIPVILPLTLSVIYNADNDCSTWVPICYGNLFLSDSLWFCYREWKLDVHFRYFLRYSNESVMTQMKEKLLLFWL